MLGSERLSSLKRAVAVKFHPTPPREAAPSQAFVNIEQEAAPVPPPFPTDQPIKPLLHRVEGFLGETKEQVVFEPNSIGGRFDLSRVQTPHSVDPHKIRTPRSILNPDGTLVENPQIYKLHAKNTRIIADRQKPSQT